MANAVTARQTGDDYQARWFWLSAFELLFEDSSVSLVTFESDKPRAFDDVIVEYEQPVVGSARDRFTQDCYQIKWQVDSSHRFGYEDLINPSFINATSVSILQRLEAAARSAHKNARFNLITTARIRDGDSLNKVISNNDQSILMEKLFDGTGDRSAMGKIRACWRDHLGLPDDEALRPIVDRLRIHDSAPTLEELGERLSIKAQLAGLQTPDKTMTDNRYDVLPRKLLARGINRYDRTEIKSVLHDEKLIVTPPTSPPDYTSVCIRSFLSISQHIDRSSSENTLSLVSEFRERYIRDDNGWQQTIRPKVVEFLKERAELNPKIRLSLDAHASIAFLAGTVLNLKTGIDVELVQKGRVTNVWRPDDQSSSGELSISTDTMGEGDIALAISMTQDILSHVRAYVTQQLPDISTFIHCAPKHGPSQQSISGGQAACQIADNIARELRHHKATSDQRTVHLFAACPNSLLFFLGQQHKSLGPTVIYEFDFDGEGNRSYQPSFIAR